MTQKVVMPELGEGVVEGELLSWRVSVGDVVQEDDILAEVMTDKASLEVPSPFSGEVKELKCKEGQFCGVGGVLLILNMESGSVSDKTSKEQESQTPHFEPAELSSDSNVATNHPQGNENILATPLIRKIARENSIDLSRVQGTGLSKRVTLQDIQNLIPSTEQEVKSINLRTGFSVPRIGPEERVPLKGIRKKIAHNMQSSKHNIPHFTLIEEVSVQSLVALREQAKKLYPDVKITYLSFVMKTLYHTFLDFPEFNASIDDSSEEIVYKKYYYFAFATDTPRGLLVPVVRDVNKKTIVQISREIKSLSDKARDGTIQVDEMKGATTTITNIGSIAGQWATPIINPPEVCILGMYRIYDKPVWKNGSYQPCPAMNFSITSDHRLIDGAVAARFMSQFAERIENPSLLLIES